MSTLAFGLSKSETADAPHGNILLPGNQVVFESGYKIKYNHAPEKHAHTNSLLYNVLSAYKTYTNSQRQLPKNVHGVRSNSALAVPTSGSTPNNF